MKRLHEAKVSGKTVLVRVDFNVPLDAEGRITDDRRIRQTLPTLNWLLEQGAAVVVCSHLGRPKGHDPKLSLKHLHNPLSDLLGRDVLFVDDCIGPKALHICKNIDPGDVVLLENLRFHPEEEQGDAEFAAQLAWNGSVYVNDAFGAAHRPHASISVIAQYFPKEKYAGLLMAAEVDNAERVLGGSKSPYIAVLGGAKVADKIPVLQNLIERLDGLFIGGGMAYTFLKAQGVAIGRSLCEDDRLEAARRILDRAAARGIPVLLPRDVVVAEAIDRPETARTVPVDSIPTDAMGLDIGPQTVEALAELLSGAQTVLWNGPVGVFEQAAFAQGTAGVAAALARACASGAYVLIGGGDTAAAIDQLSDPSLFSYVSTGGGALLEYLEGRELPGLAALT